MVPMLLRWVAAAHRRQREKALVRDLLLLNDHLLADIGLRRDQLQPDGIHELDVGPVPARARDAAQRPAVHAIPRPSMQGCG